MITKEELLTIPRLHQKMIDDVQRLKWLEAKAECIPSPCNLKADKVQTSHTNRAGRYVDSAYDLRCELEERHTDLEAMKTRAIEWIRTLTSERAKRVMTLLYVDCHSVRYTANVENISMRRVNQIRLGALSKLETN